MLRGMDDRSSDNDGMGGSSSLAASASGLPDGNHQRHQQRKKGRGESAPLGKRALPYIMVFTDVNEMWGCADGMTGM
jgi:hypothetical protein